MGRSPRSFWRLVVIILVLLAFGLWGWLDHFSLAPASDWGNPQRYIELARDWGWAGPVLVVVTMAAAIVVSPLPSAPIAMASGALYGHFAGTFYVFVGALLGSSIAFAIARTLGLESAQRWLERRFPDWKLSDQRRLMGLVFISRLLPFISFDLVSYGAGITALTYGRFLLATAAGILPASFLLAHFGEAALEQSLLFNGVIVAALLLAALVTRLRGKRRRRP